MTAGGHNRLSDSLRTRALQLAKDGFTAKQISYKLHIPISTVRAWVSRRMDEKVPELPEGIKLLHAWPQGPVLFVVEGDSNE